MLETLETQECLEACRKLRQELEEASNIPEWKLSGELGEAIKIVRGKQKAMAEDIFQKLLFLVEKR